MFNETPKSKIEQEQPFNLEEWLDKELPRQYDEKVKILIKLGLIDEILPQNQDMGIVAIDGKEYPMPEKEQIKEAILKNKEVFETKMKQGFTELQITPFGLPLERFTKVMEETILKHHREGKLFSARKNPEDESEPLVKLDLDESKPVGIGEEYQNADIDGKMKYYPDKYAEIDHGGQNKRELLKNKRNGIMISLTEKNIHIPKEGADEAIVGRKRLEANLTPNVYLKLLQTKPEYQNEQGQTPEEWITQFLTYLKKYNQVMDDNQGHGKASYQLGAYFPAFGDVPVASWFRDSRQAYLGGHVPGSQYEYYGARLVARVL